MKALFLTERNDEKPITVPFTDRLRFTIAQMEAETQQGGEDWTPTIARLKEVLEAEAAETGQNPFGGIDLSNFDIDGDGEIDWQEFVAAIMDDHELHNEENLAKVFRQLQLQVLMQR
jgi:hypothetical protein